MTPFKLGALALLLAAAPWAQALDVGQCGNRTALMKALAGEGQQMLVRARDFANASAARVFVTRNADSSTGYLLRETGPRGLCIDAALSQLRSGAQVHTLRDDQALIARQCGKAGDPALCRSLRNARQALARLKVVTVVESGPGRALQALPGMQGIDRHAPAQAWSSAQLGFCRGSGGALVLCVSSYTRAPG